MFDDTAGDVPILVQLEDIRTTLREEAENRKVDETGLKLYDCLANCIGSLIFAIDDAEVSTEELEKFVSAKTLQRNVVILLQDHAKNLKSVLPLLVDNYPISEAQENDSERKEYNKLVDEFYTKIISELTDGDYYQAYTKLCLYACATCINTPIYVCSIDQQWKFFEPLFNFHGQPKHVLRYITMYMARDNLFYKVESTDREAPPPKATGLVGMYMQYLEDIPTVTITVPEELRQIPDSSKTKLCYSVGKEVITECCGILRKIGHLSEEEHGQLAAHRANRSAFCKKMTDSQDAFDTLCKVLIKRRDKSTLSSYIPNWSLFVRSCEYLSQYDALIVLDSAIFERNLSVAAFASACQIGTKELNERRRKVTTAVIASSSIGIASGGLIIAGIILAPVSFGASLGLSIAGGALGVGTGVAAGTARVVEAVKQNSKLKDINTEQAIIKEREERVSAAMENVEKLFQTLLTKAQRSPDEGPGISRRGFLALGSAFRSAHSVASIALAAARLGTTAASVSAAILGPLSLVFDVAFLAEAAHNKSKGDKTNAGYMLQSMAETVEIKCKIFNNMLRGDCEDNERLFEWS